MFIVLLNYIKSLAEVERFLDEHKAYLQKYYASGNFLMSGRKEPRTGGVVVVMASSRNEVEHIIAQDPFHRERLASYEITEFMPTMVASGLEQYQVA
jgi:uncharacterized protein YciI